MFSKVSSIQKRKNGKHKKKLRDSVTIKQKQWNINIRKERPEHWIVVNILINVIKLIKSYLTILVNLLSYLINLLKVRKQ